MTTVRFEGIWKFFDSAPVVADLNLDVDEGEFLVFVGPSGCGKTTSLRMLAGLERPTYGRVWMGDKLINTVPPGKRNIAMVFQSYALYPHMTVFENLAFGPRVRREGKEEMGRRIRDAATTLGISELLQRKPSELSGGQRQRVALGRAIIRQPDLFLLDEPLSNLDASLRVQMRAELIRLHQQFSVTTVYVTHDQVEAMTMGDRIAVMSDGCLQQVDSPDSLYENPCNLFVATFIGSPKMNLFPAEMVKVAPQAAVRCLGITVQIAKETPLIVEQMSGRDVILGIRPEDIGAAQGTSFSPSARLSATVDIVEPLGSETYVTTRVADTALVSRFPSRSRVRSGDTVELAFDPLHIYLFDKESGASVLDRSALSDEQADRGAHSEGAAEREARAASDAPSVANLVEGRRST